MPLYDYVCGHGHRTESLQRMERDAILCPECQSPAHRLAAYRTAIVTTQAVDSRGLFRRFSEASAELDYAATKVEQSTGEPVVTPNYWAAAKQQAQAMVSAGEAPALRKD